jgi:hypothetical protein
MASRVGLAHVGAVSFLAARVTPAGSFWLSLTGGAALAREADLRGMRAGYASSAAAMLETVAIFGPLRINNPLTQAISAPLLGAMHAKGRRPVRQFLACLILRLLHYTVITALAVFILIGTKAYAGSYHTLFGWLPFLPKGLAGALVLTAIVDLLAAIFFSAVQVWFYRQALTDWDQRVGQQSSARPVPAASTSESAALDPRIALVAATLVTVLLLVSHSWPVLGAVAAWLAVAWIFARHGDREVVRVGLILAATLALGTLIPSLIGGLGIDEAAQRTVRAALLVMVPTWLRLAAGSAGLREAFRRTLLRVPLPGSREASEILSELDTGPRLTGSAKTLRDRLRGVEREILPVVNAVLVWAASEAQSVPVHVATRAERVQLRLRPGDGLLAASVLFPACALAAILVP